MKKIITIVVALALASVLFAQEANDAQAKKWGVVDFSANFMREKPGFDEENGDQALMGTVVEILAEEDGWIKMRSPEPYVAWGVSRGVAKMTEAEKDAYIAAPKFICVAEYTHILTEPKAGSERVCDFVIGDLVRKTGVTKGKWVKVLLPSGREGWVLKNEVKDFAEWVAASNPTREDILATAKLFIGVPYMWGGTSIKNVDCSGFTRSVYFLNGILLPRNASQQAKVGIEVPYEEAQPGDLIFFGRSATADRPERVSHVTIYLGGDRIIHSASVVRMNSLRKGEPDYYGGNRLHVRRILGQADAGTGVVSIAKSPFYFKQ